MSDAILYSQQFDSDYLESAHLDGDVTLEISEVVPKGKLKAKDGKLIDKPILKFKGAKRGYVMCKTTAKVVALMYGNNMAGWIGKKITLFPTTCKAFGKDNTPCIRVRFEEQG